MCKYVMGIDVGGTKIAYGLFDDHKKMIDKYVMPSDDSLENEAFFDEICKTIRYMLLQNKLTLEQLEGIGIGMPSFILYEEGKIIKTSNLQKIKDFPARQYIQTKLDGKIRVVLDNDSHTGALAEHRHGAGKGFKHMLYCPVSTGISSGIIINNQLFRGSYGWSGESGHMLVTPGSGIACGCGNQGCLMSYCSGGMIVKHIQQWIDEGEETLMVQLAGSPEKINGHHICEAYDLGDSMAQKAVEQMAQYMGVWLYNLYLILNINCFVLGGGLLNFGDRLFKRVREIFDEYNQDDMPVYIKYAKLGDDFGIIGAAELLF